MLKRVFGMLLLVVLVACGSSAPAAPVTTDDEIGRAHV